MNPAQTWVALVHHPVYDKHRKIVATALTNLDLHDIARSSRTYGLAGFFIVHPVEAQRQLAERIASHWREEGAAKNDFRRQAIDRVRVVSTLVEARKEIETATGAVPYLIATSAKNYEKSVDYNMSCEGPVLLILGTGYGLTDEVIATTDAMLKPVQGASDYNHLSVRSACAIILDRLYGDRQD